MIPVQNTDQRAITMTDIASTDEQLRTAVVDAACIEDDSVNSENDNSNRVDPVRTLIEDSVKVSEETSVNTEKKGGDGSSNPKLLPPTLPLQKIIPNNAPELHDFGKAPDLSNSQAISEKVFNQLVVFVQPEKNHELTLPNPGDTIDNYCIEELIGTGGFGAVYRAKNISLGRDEAIKIILPSARNNCQDIEKRFAREIDIISRLEHPNVMRLYNCGVFSGSLMWMSSELIHGERLDERLKNYGAMKYPKARNLMLQLLSGLMEAHRRYIMHRDLKPSNIMLSKKEGYADQLIILDFGLSKALGEHENANVQQLTQTMSRRVYGTPQYMAPEQFGHEINANPGPWTDVYAAGLIFYEMLTGHPAMTGRSAMDIAYRQLYEEIVYPADWTGKAVMKIIKKACSKNPSERYKDAGDFFDDLQKVENFTDDESVLENSSTERRPLNDLGLLSSTRKEASPRQTEVLDPIEEEESNKKLSDEARTRVAIRFVQVTAYILAILFIICVILLSFGFYQIQFF